MVAEIVTAPAREDRRRIHGKVRGRQLGRRGDAAGIDRRIARLGPDADRLDDLDRTPEAHIAGRRDVDAHDIRNALDLYRKADAILIAMFAIPVALFIALG